MGAPTWASSWPQPAAVGLRQHLEISRQVWGAYGGGAFPAVLSADPCSSVGFPVMLAELSISRATRKNGGGASPTLNPRWRFAGYIGITLIVILSYYCGGGG